MVYPVDSEGFGNSWQCSLNEALSNFRREISWRQSCATARNNELHLCINGVGDRLGNRFTIVNNFKFHSETQITQSLSENWTAGIFVNAL
ncbi:unannotated protein [freshwater metagenome]|uniref:Unannotated protein n=1 Tax=freshwater metagenome TaxID=449393 RepID=A0A6J7TSW0_9ZZZZ